MPVAGVRMAEMVGQAKGGDDEQAQRELTAAQG
jgi:hypothetical protein